MQAEAAARRVARVVGSAAVPGPSVVDARAARRHVGHRHDQRRYLLRLDALALRGGAHERESVAVEELRRRARPALAPAVAPAHVLQRSQLRQHLVERHPDGQDVGRRKVKVGRVAVEDERRRAGWLGPHLVLCQPSARRPAGQLSDDAAERRAAGERGEGLVALPNVDQLQRALPATLAREAERAGALGCLGPLVWRRARVVLAAQQPLEPRVEPRGKLGRHELRDAHEAVGVEVAGGRGAAAARVVILHASYAAATAAALAECVSATRHNFGSAVLRPRLLSQGKHTRAVLRRRHVPSLHFP